MFIRRKDYEEILRKNKVYEEENEDLSNLVESLKTELKKKDDSYKQSIKDYNQVFKDNNHLRKDVKELKEKNKISEKNIRVLAETLLAIKKYCKNHSQSQIAKTIMNEIKLEEK